MKKKDYGSEYHEKRAPINPFSFLKQASKDIKVTEKELKETEFDKEWDKWGKPKTKQG